MGGRKVVMAELREALKAAGYPDASTHIQTGNIILTSNARTSDSLGRDLEAALRKHADLDVDVMVRSDKELERIVRGNPFPTRGVDPTTLCVGFLRSRPDAAAIRALGTRDFGDDQVAVRGDKAYLSYPHGQGRSKMSGAVLERTLATRLTVRNWNVVNKLVELTAEADRRTT